MHFSNTDVKHNKRDEQLKESKTSGIRSLPPCNADRVMGTNLCACLDICN